MAVAFAVCGWIGSSAGSLAFAAITERDHILAVSLGDGHLDLVREHAGTATAGGVAQPIDPDHVVHLCHSLDAASSRPQARTATTFDSLSTPGPGAPLRESARLFSAPRASFALGRRPPSSTVLRL